MDRDKGGRKRSANFSHGEKENLIWLVEKYFNVIENKKTNAVFNKEKTNCWEKIAREFNAVHTTGVRTGSQLRVTYEKMKQIAKKHQAEDKMGILKTGGGTCTPTVTDIDEKILSILKKNFFSVENPFDSNSGRIENSNGNKDYVCTNDFTSSNGNNKENYQEEIILIYENKDSEINACGLDLPEDFPPSVQCTELGNKHSMKLDNIEYNILGSTNNNNHYDDGNNCKGEASSESLNNQTTTPFYTPSRKVNIAEKQEETIASASRRKKRKLEVPLKDCGNARKELLHEKKIEVLQNKIDLMKKMELVEDENLKYKVLQNEIQELIKKKEQIELKIKEIEYKKLFL